MAMKTGLVRMWGMSGHSMTAPGRSCRKVRIVKWAIRNSSISPARIPNVTNTVSLTPLTFGKKYLAARAPGRNIDPMNSASRNRYPRLVSTIATSRMETTQKDMTRKRFIGLMQK